ncbi:MAG: hypothetical protein U1F68_13395 [Gammaproteobacteria bacterium]
MRQAGFAKAYLVPSGVDVIGSIDERRIEFRIQDEYRLPTLVKHILVTAHVIPAILSRARLRPLTKKYAASQRWLRE